MRNALLVATSMIVSALCATAVGASSGGIVRFSGKTNQTCSACHAGGTLPEVRFEGPTEVAADATATFRFVLISEAPSQDQAGFNVAASAGTLRTITGQRSRLLSGELTHSDPKDVDDEEASWQFEWVAPPTAGEQTLYGAGNAVNGNGNPTGDRARATTFKVQVIGGLPTATATATIPATHTRTATATRTATTTRTATRTATAVNAATSTRTATLVPTVTASSTATMVIAVATATQTPTRTPTRTPTETFTISATAFPTATATPSITESQSLATPTPTETVIATATETQTASVAPTDTMTPSPSVSPSATDGAASPTATATTTPTIAPPCVGDCDGDQRVSVSELVTGVNIALDRATVALCRAFDRDNDERVTVAELVEAVSRALEGC